MRCTKSKTTVVPHVEACDGVGELKDERYAQHQCRASHLKLVLREVRVATAPGPALQQGHKVLLKILAEKLPHATMNLGISVSVCCAFLVAASAVALASASGLPTVSYGTPQGVVLAAFDSIMDAAVGFNGVYDMACCFAILLLPRWRIARLHIQVFSAEVHTVQPLWHRILAYWIFTYGIIRFISAVYRSPMMDGLCAISYLIEAVTYGFEWLAYKSTLQGAAFVSIASLGLAVVMLLRSIFRLPQALSIFDGGATYTTIIWICFVGGIVFSALSLVVAIFQVKKQPAAASWSPKVSSVSEESEQILKENLVERRSE